MSVFNKLDLLFTKIISLFGETPPCYSEIRMEINLCMCMWDWNFAGLERIDSLHSLFTPSSFACQNLHEIWFGAV